MKKGIILSLSVVFLLFAIPALAETLIIEAVVDGETKDVAYGHALGDAITITGMISSEKQTMLTFKNGAGIPFRQR